MQSALHPQDAARTLKEAEQALAGGGISCRGPSVDRDLELFQAWSDAIQSSATAISKAGEQAEAAVARCIRSMIDYALFVQIIASKPTVMQLLYHENLVARRKRVHSAVDTVRKFVQRIPAKDKASEPTASRRLEQLQTVLASVDFSELSNQLEPLAYISNQEQKGNCLDTITEAVKDQILRNAVDYVKTTTSALPDWYMSECDLIFSERHASGVIKALTSDSNQCVELRRDFVSCGWDDPYQKITPQEQFAMAVGMWSSLRHENLCSVIGANSFSLPDAMVVTESCVLGSINSFLLAKTSERQKRAMTLLIQAAHAVRYLHSVNIVHGELRSDKILITGDHKAKVAGPSDYLAWFEAHSGMQTPNKKPNPGATETTRWLAPEIVAGDSGPTREADVFSFGLVMYETLTGAIPYGEVDDSILKAKKPMLNPVPHLRSLDKLDSEVRSIVERACDVNPADRPTMQVLLERLQGIGRVSDQSTAARTAIQAPSASNQTHAASSTRPATATISPLPPQEQSALKTQPTNTQATNKVSPLTQPTVSVASSLPPLSTPPERANDIVVVNSATPRWIKAAVGVLLLLLFILIIVIGTKKISTISVVTTAPAPTVLPTPVPSSSSTPPQPSASPTAAPTAAPTPAPTPAPTQAPAPTPTPAPTPPPTPAPTTKPPSVVSTFASGFTREPVTSITIANDSSIYVSDAYQVFRLAETYPYPAPYAGTRTFGSTSGFRINAQFNGILGTAVDSFGNVFVADGNNYLIRSIVASGGQVSTLAGNGSSSSVNGATIAASIGKPYDVAVDGSNNAYVADFYGDSVRKVWTASARVSTLGGKVEWPRALAVTPSGTVFVASKHGIVGLSTDGSSTWAVAGSVSSAGFQTGTGASARFDTIRGLALSPTGDELYVADTNNHCIRKVNVNSFVVTTIAGECGTSGSTDGGALQSRFIRPMGLAVSYSGVIYIVDGGSSFARVRKLTL